MSAYSPAVEQHMRVLYESLSEKYRRRYAAVEAEKLGHGGITYIAELFDCDETRFAKEVRMWPNYPRTPLPVASEKKGGRTKASLSSPAWSRP